MAVILEAVDELVGDDASNFVGDAVFGDAVDIVETEVDFFVVVVELGAERVCDAVHAAEDECYGSRAGDGGGGVGWRGVEKAQDVVDAIGNAVGDVEGCEDAGCAGVAEVADLEAQFGKGEVGWFGSWGGGCSWRCIVENGRGSRCCLRILRHFEVCFGRVCVVC